MNETTEPSFDQLVILNALQVKGKHIYAGTVPEHVVARRRAKNRVARKSRRTNRKG